MDGWRWRRCSTIIIIIASSFSYHNAKGIENRKQDMSFGKETRYSYGSVRFWKKTKSGKHKSKMLNECFCFLLILFCIHPEWWSWWWWWWRWRRRWFVVFSLNLLQLVLAFMVLMIVFSFFEIRLLMCCDGSKGNIFLGRRIIYVYIVWINLKILLKIVSTFRKHFIKYQIAEPNGLSDWLLCFHMVHADSPKARCLFCWIASITYIYYFVRD